MKKFYFLLAGLFVAALPMSAQTEGPVRTDKDSKVIFTQDFESDWTPWSTTAVDTIPEIWYYDVRSLPGADTLELVPLLATPRDTVFPLYNGVKLGDDDDVAKGYYDGDSYTILTDDPSDYSRRDAFAEYGVEGSNYGPHYFSYIAGTYGGSESNWSNGVSPEYRRNLFVRGLPIEDETSYRLTVYVKVTPSDSISPKFCADVMRGYANSEKPFTMGYKDDAANYLYDGEFAYTKTDFTGDWEKVTFMTYYINDEIADKFMYAGSHYYWKNSWTWKNYKVGATDSLQYIKQPDKFFVRLSFSSNDTKYEIDNLSLTKSWIGGVEHYSNMLRVDFGYDTNMDELTAQAKERTNIAVVEVPGKYFTVWGFTKWGDWEEVPIQTAEYHGDGYMYMWTEPFESGGYSIDRNFDEYDSVLVSFTNPVDRPELCLHYDGELFPKANDIEWIKNGKLLPDFVNEVSTLNPHIGNGVYSIKVLPPVVQRLPYENGSFGLDGSVRELTLRMSRKIAFDNKGESSKLAFLRVTKSGVSEIWTVKSVTDSTATFERPASCKDILDGEYKFEFLNLTWKASPSALDYGDDVVCNWEFGAFDKNPSVKTILQTDFRSETSAMRQIPGSLVSWNSKDGFVTEQPSTQTKCDLLYLVAPEGSKDDCAFYLSSRSSKMFGHLYYGLQKGYYLELDKGKYALNFKATYWNANAIETRVYVYENKFTDDIKAVQKVTDRTLIGTFVPTTKISYSKLRAGTEPWPDNVDNYTFEFEVTKKGKYVIEFEVDKPKDSDNSDGSVIGNLNITAVAGLSFTPVSTFNNAMAAAREKLALAKNSEKGKYLGADYTSFKSLVDSYEGWEDTKPSAYANTTAIINRGTADMQLRMDTVDLFNDTYAAVADTLKKEVFAQYTGLDAYKALKKLADDNANYNFAAKTTPEITSVIGQFNDGMAALSARKVLIDKWIVKLGEIEAALGDSLARKGYAEYGDLETYYNANRKNDVIAPSDEQMQQMYDAACLAKNSYVFRCDLVDARTRQIKELFALNEKLGATFDGKKDSLQQQIDALMDGDDQLEEMLRAAAIWHLTSALAEKDPIVNGLDVSALVPNYYLYTTEKALSHMRLNSSGMWILKESSDEIYPHWYTTYSSGNSHPGATALDWENEAHTYIAGHFMELSGCSYISTTVEGLPAAYYNVKFDVVKIAGGSSYTCISTDGDAKVSYELKNTKNATGLIGQDSVLVSAGSKLTASFENRSASSSGTYNINALSLILNAPDASYNYTQAVNDAKDAFDEIRTFVGDVKAASNVKYYNLNGVQMNAPKAGQIVIRKTTLENGKTVNEKVLVK